MLLAAAIVLIFIVLTPLWVSIWASWTRDLGKRADQTPLVTPELVPSGPGWRFRLPWFRRKHEFLESVGYRHIGWIDERYHPRFTIKFSVHWNAEHRSYALVLSVLGRAYFSLLAMAGPFLVRTSRNEQSRWVVGPKFFHAGYPDPQLRLEAHHRDLAMLREEYEHEGHTPSMGSVHEAITLLRARAVRGASDEPGFVFGPHSVEPDDLVVRVDGARTPEDACAVVLDALPEPYQQSWRSEKADDATGLLWAILSCPLPTHERIVVIHDRYPGVMETQQQYLDMLCDVLWGTTHVVVVFEARLN